MTLPGRGGLPVALAALAVIAAASTSASASKVDELTGPPPVAAGITLPPVVPPTPSYPPGTSTFPSGTSAFPTTGRTVPGSSPGTPLPIDRASAPAAEGLTASGIPSVAMQAYQMAAATAGCGLPWTLLAAIGRVESNHGRFAGATLLADGRSDPPIVGIPLDGRPGVATIRDTDGGQYDGDLVYDRAVGPMQFIPGTWAMFATDGDADGTADPFNLTDAAAAAATYLCRAGRDLSTEAGQRNAVFSYNRSDSYVQLVLDLSGQYAGGAPIDDLPAPDRTPRPLPPITTPTLPPVAIGDPPAVTTPRPAPRPTTPKPTPSTPRPTTPSPTPRPTTPAPTSGPTTPPPTTTPAPTTGPMPPPTTPAPTCTPAPTGTGTPTPSGSPTPTGTPSPSPTPTLTPTPTPTVTPTGTPTPSAGPTGTPTPTPTGTPTTCPTP